MELKPWQEYFVKQVSSQPFAEIPPWQNDKELIAHSSIDRFIDYYCYSGSAHFWTILSMLIKPKVIVEFGTAMGIRTRLFARLNPEAVVHSIDKNTNAGTSDAKSGYVAEREENVKLYIGNSNELVIENVDLCYVDANHSSEFVYQDSHRAWSNKSKDRSWAIVWDDYHLESVKRGLHFFVEGTDCRLVKFGGICITGTDYLLDLITSLDKNKILESRGWIDKQEQQEHE